MNSRQFILLSALLCFAVQEVRGDGPVVTIDRPCPVGKDPLDEALETVDRVFEWPILNNCSECRPRTRLWFSADYMLASFSGTATPPLVTTSVNGVPFGTAAVLGNPGTNIVVGGSSLEANPMSGVRLGGGAWTSDRRGLEIVGFFFPTQSKSESVAGTGNAQSIAVGRPFVNLNTGAQTVAYSAFADQLSGGSSATYSTSLWGIEANALFRDPTGDRLNFAFLAGVRYLDLDQQIEAQDFTSSPLGIPFVNQLLVTSPDLIRVTDTFQTQNQFVGGQIGVRSSLELGRIELGAGAKLAIGATYQRLQIAGESQIIQANGQVFASTPGGLLANAGNSGSYSRTVGSIVPELDFKVGYRVTPNCTLFVSYNLLYWDNVAQVGNQISPVVNPQFIPTNTPFNVPFGTVGRAVIARSDFTVNTIMFGATVKY